MGRFAEVLVIAALFLPLLVACQSPLTGIENLEIVATEAEIEIDQQDLEEAQTPYSDAMPSSIDLIASPGIFEQLYEQVNPGVVAIRVLTLNGRSLGSGFIFDRDGHIVTNYHVVQSEADLEVTFSDGEKVRGKILARDDISDLAVIEVDLLADELSPLRMGDSDRVKVGQVVAAIGNPFGLNDTMTLGIISGIGRDLSAYQTSSSSINFPVGNILQTDASIHPGSSGGPLLNLAGEVIGVNESVATNGIDRKNSGIGFAIPINLVKRIVPALIENGNYDYPYLGVSSLNEVTLFEKDVLELPQAGGVYITAITEGGPADRAGLQAGEQASGIPGAPLGGDLIIAVDGRAVQDYNDLMAYIVHYKSPGDLIILTVLRGEERLEIKLVLDKRPSQ